MSQGNRVRKLGRYSLVSIGLLGVIASTALWNAPAYAATPTELSCGNAPEPGADYLSDPCAWGNLRASEQAASGHNAEWPAPQRQQERRGDSKAPIAQ